MVDTCIYGAHVGYPRGFDRSDGNPYRPDGIALFRIGSGSLETMMISTAYLGHGALPNRIVTACISALCLLGTGVSAQVVSPGLTVGH